MPLFLYVRKGGAIEPKVRFPVGFNRTLAEVKTGGCIYLLRMRMGVRGIGGEYLPPWTRYTVTNQ